MTERGEWHELNLQYISSIITGGHTTENGSALPNNSNNTTISNKLKFKIYGNLIAVSIAFSVYHVGIFPINIIQDSLDLDSRLQMASLIVHTASMVMQCLFFNSMILELLGMKRAILVGIALEVAYIGTNMHPRWWTLIPAAFISGLGRPLMHTAGCIIISKMATLYTTSYKRSNNPKRIKWNFFSIYFIFYAGAKVIGDIVTSLILGTGLQKFDPSEMKTDKVNLSSAFTFCGPNFCDKTPSHSLLLSDGLYDRRRIHFQIINELCGISLGCLVAASLVMLLFVQSLETLGHVDKLNMMANGTSTTTVQTNRVTWHHLFDTILSWKNPKQTLLLPLLLYNAMNQAFFVNEFTKSFVFCLYGNEMVGPAMAWFGLTAPITLCVFSIFKRHSCHSIPFLVAFGVHLGTLITLLHLNSTYYNYPTLFIILVTWGAGSGLWPYCLSAFSATVFDQHLSTAFSNYYLFDTLGKSLNYTLGYYLCTEMKLYTLIGLLSLGFSGYSLVEIFNFRQQERKANS